MAKTFGLSGPMLGAVAGGAAVVVAFVGWQAWEIRNSHGNEAASAVQSPAAALENPAATQAATQSRTPAASVAAPDDPQPAAPATPPRFDTFRLSKDSGAVVAGMAPNAQRVAIVMDGVEATSVDVAANGGFAAVFDIKAAAVPRVMTLRAEYADGSALVSSESIVVAPEVPVPVAAVAKPDEAQPVPSTPDSIASNAGAEPILPQPANLLLSEGRVTVLRPVAGGALSIDTITYADSGAVEVAGHGDSGQILRLYLDNQLQFETPISGQGDWTGALPDVAPGLYALRADVLDPSGKVTARSETPFLREATEAVQQGANAPAVQLVTVQPGYTLWGIAKQTYGEGQSYVTVFEANRAQIRNPDLIYPGQIFTLPKGAN